MDDKTAESREMLHSQFYTSIPCIPLSIVTIILDLFVINYYRKSKLSLVSLLYTLISVVDIITAIGLLHQSISVMLFTQGAISLTTLDENTYVFNPMFQLGYRTSVFYNLVLSVSRTIIMLQPFYRIKIKTVAVVCILDLVFWIVIAGLDGYLFHFFHSSGFLASISTTVLLQPIYTLGLGLSFFIGLYTYAAFAINVLSLLIPTLIIIITCLIQVIALYRSRNVTSSVTNQRQVTITVVMMSALFVVCNSSFYVWMITTWIAGGSAETGYSTISAVYGILGIMFPILNAALNPVIIISRSNGLREHFMEKVPLFKRKISQRRNEVEMTHLDD